MRGTLKVAVAAATAIAAAGPANALIIDSFDGPQQTLVLGGAPAGGANGPVSGSAAVVLVGGTSDFASSNRAMNVMLSADESSQTNDIPFTGGLFSMSKGADAASETDLIYSGGNLGTFDLTMDGAGGIADTFAILVESNTTATRVFVGITDSNNIFERIAIDSTNCTPGVFSNPGTVGNVSQVGGNAPAECLISYSSFLNADLTSVAQISLETEQFLDNGLATVLGLFETQNIVADPVVVDPVPAPAGIFLIAAGLLGMRRFRK